MLKYISSSISFGLEKSFYGNGRLIEEAYAVEVDYRWTVPTIVKEICLLTNNVSVNWMIQRSCIFFGDTVFSASRPEELISLLFLVYYLKGKLYLNRIHAVIQGAI